MDKQCPRCTTNRPVSKWGFFKGRERFRCLGCGRTFTDKTVSVLRERGRIDLERNYRILVMRVKMARTVRELYIPPDVEEEAIQMACLDVLLGRGSCRDVPLRIGKAWESARRSLKMKTLRQPE